MQIDVEQKNYIIAQPIASSMIESLRAFGYNPQTAIADIIDNSISAGAKNVWIKFFWDGESSYISVLDDGRGMSEEDLNNAMRPGSKSPLEDRHPEDLGRFGLGLKTASFSQCRRLTVSSRKEHHRKVTRCWDLDYVIQTGEWRLLTEPYPESNAKIMDLNNVTTGTLILWEHLDRLVDNAKVTDDFAHARFLELAEEVKSHLSMVFHRFLARKDRLQIWLGQEQIEPWDPYLNKQSATQQLNKEILPLYEKKVIVQPYILPHHSKIDSSTHKKAAGPKGWNAQQGFYIYRNERLLVAGDWLGLGCRKEEHCKLARIQVDISNEMDEDWCIDVKKSTARPPSALKVDLKRIAKVTREQAISVYRHRGKILSREVSDKTIYPWIKKVKHGTIFYSVNRDHPLVMELERLPEENKKIVLSLIRLIEETVPIPMIAFNNAETPDKYSHYFEEATESEVKDTIIQTYKAMINQGYTSEEALNRLLIMEPFNHFENLVNNTVNEINSGEI
ncbi:MAG: ATP-binding protein [Crenarchaeota archaeon]|nr:ATP-binding protein [Thermoproteota archaeon]